MKTSRLIVASCIAGLLLAVVPPNTARAQQPETYARLFAGMRWRSVGPLRGGRTKACSGVAGQPGVFFIGVCNGGVWKTDDFGRTWQPIFDDQPTGSIGAIAVAPSNPNIVYVGSGEGLQRPDLSTGDGIYKSVDAGVTWTHLGLRDGQQIPHIAVDPRNPERLFVAVLGHPYGPNAERGVFRSTDGGLTYEKVLFKDDNTGASDVEIDPRDSSVVYAALWEARQGPWENAAWSGTGGGIFKSTDGGTSWRQLTKGLPETGVIQADIAVAPSAPNRIVATVASAQGVGIYRSDDAGETWVQITTDPRPARRIGGGDLPVPTIDPQNPDVVVMSTVVAWRSTDGARTWKAFRGAPGGDDYQRAWIDPNNGNIVLLTSDQGAIVTVNGGRTWSSWYNQPTSQMYHVSADNDFPYRVCSGQQESGSACVSSRGDDGQITFREWHPVGAEEYGYVAPDPLDPDIVYGGRVERYDRRTGQVQEVGPKPLRGDGYRVVRTQPVIFSPVDPHVLYFSSNTLWKTTDGGNNWLQISPDLTRKTWDVPANVGKYRDAPTAKPTQRGVIYTVAPSPIDGQRIWVGSDDGLVNVTTNGGQNWRDVTPPQLVPWAKVSILEASHSDPQTAYAAINTLRLDDLKPYIYRTRDGGTTWTRITNGIPDGATVNVVREDPKRKGLLYAGTEREVYVSFDDGENWQSLRLNMPASSIRDLVVKDDDLIAATHGRGFWILDDVTPLRQIDDAAGRADVVLFRPQDAYRVRWNLNTDTPLPPDEPGSANPPDGAIIDYILKDAATGPVVLEILDGSGAVVRRYSSADEVAPIDPDKLSIPPYWVRPQQSLSAAPGMHRFTWDMHYGPAPGADPDYPISAVAHNTALSPTSPWVMPGQYTVRLTVGGREYTQQLTVKMDPRVKTTLADLGRQFSLSQQVYDAIGLQQSILDAVRAVRAQLKALAVRSGESPSGKAISDLDAKLAVLEGGGAPGFGAPVTTTLTGIRSVLDGLLEMLQGADVAPTSQASAAVADQVRALADLETLWKAIETGDLPSLNSVLKRAGLTEVTAKPR